MQGEGGISFGVLAITHLQNLDCKSYTFHKKTSKKMESVLESFTKMKHSYREVSVMFSENPDTMDPADFFTIFHKFINSWKVRTSLFSWDGGQVALLSMYVL